MEGGEAEWRRREGGYQRRVICEHSLTANPFRSFPTRFYFPRPGKAGVSGKGRGGGGGGGGGGEGDISVIYEGSLTPSQVFLPILTFFVPFNDKFKA